MKTQQFTTSPGGLAVEIPMSLRVGCPHGVPGGVDNLPQGRQRLIRAMLRSILGVSIYI